MSSLSTDKSPASAPAPAEDLGWAPSPFSAFGSNFANLEDLFGGGTTPAVNPAKVRAADDSPAFANSPEWGFSAKDGISRSQDVNGQGGKYTVKDTARVVPDSASYGKDASIKGKQGGVTTRGNVGGKVTADVKVEKCAEPEFRVLVVTLDLSGAAGFGVGGILEDERLKSEAPASKSSPPAPSASIEGGLAVKGNARVSLRHRVPAEDAERLRAALTEPGADVPGLLGEVGTLASAALHAPNSLALCSSASAASLPDGDGVELTLGGEVGAELGGKATDGVDGVNAKVNGSVSGKRTVRVTRKKVDGVDQVLIRVQLESANKAGIAAGMSTTGAGAGASAATSASASDTYEFALDADGEHFHDDYTAILSAVDGAALARLDAELGAKHTAMRGTGDENATEAQVFGLGLATNRSASLRTGTTTNAGETHANSAATGSIGAPLTLFGAELLGFQDAEEMSGATSSEGGSASLGRTSNTRVASALACGKNEQTALSIGLTAADLGKLGDRAMSDAEVWADIGMDVWQEACDPWIDFGRALGAGKPDPEALDAGIPHAEAIDAARFEALATLVSKAGGRGIEAMIKARGAEWDRRSSDKTREEKTSERIGTVTVWPAGTESAQAAWDEVRAVWDSIQPEVTAVIDADSAEDATAAVDAAEDGLLLVERTIHQHADAFSAHADVAAEMLVDVADRLSTVDDWRKEIAERALGDDANASAIGTCADDALARIAVLEGVCRSNKRVEAGLFTRAEAELGFFGSDDALVKIGDAFFTLYSTWSETFLTLQSERSRYGLDAGPTDLVPDGPRFLRVFPDTQDDSKGFLRTMGTL